MAGFTTTLEEAPTRDPNAKSEIQAEVCGKTRIRFDSCIKAIGVENPLFYYDGVVEYECSKVSVKAVVLAFDSCYGDFAVDLCDNLSSLSSTYVMNVLAYGEGSGDRCSWSYLALPLFQQTFASFIEEESQMTAKNGRFAEEFAKVTRDVVKGIVNIHNRGFFCPNFDAKHVAVSCEDGHLSAKIWNFCLAGSKTDMLGDWPRLACKIEKAAKNHMIFSLEIEDLCKKMKSGQLTGLNILKHSALLSASVKLNNVLALNLYVKTFCIDRQQQHPYINDAIKCQIHDDLLRFLDDNSGWYSRDTPEWILNINKARRISEHQLENGEAFIFELRSMHEHGNFYVQPPEEPIEDSELAEDSELTEDSKAKLEELFRNIWEEDFLKIQNFVTDLELEYG